MASVKTAKFSSPLHVGDQTVHIDERKLKVQGGYPSNRSPSAGQRAGDARQGQGRGHFPRPDGRFEGRDGRDGGRGGVRGGSSRGYPPRRGGTAAAN